MAQIKSSLVLRDAMTPVLRSTIRALNSTLTAMKSIKNVQLGASFAQATRDIQAANTAFNRMEKSLGNLDKKMKETNNSTNVLSTRLRGLATAATAFSIGRTSDDLTNAQARLSLLVEEEKQVKSLSDQIYSMSQTTFTGYTSQLANVAKMGVLARDAFKDTDELVKFNELLNKSFIISGAGTREQEAAMYQLIQSLGAGRLQGDELRSIREQAPMLAYYIQEYVHNVMGLEGNLVDLASEGILTAEVIKNSMAVAAEEIEQRFEKMPITFGRAWTMFKNSAIKAFEPLTRIIAKVLLLLSKVLDFISSNTYIFYVLAGAIAVVIVHNKMLEVSKFRVLRAVVALRNGVLSLVTAFNIFVGITAIVIIALLNLWSTNDEAAYYMLYAWDAFLIGLKGFALGWKAIWYGLLDFIGYFKVGALRTLDTFINSAIGLINGFIELLNNIPGVEIDAIAHISTMGLDAATEEAKLRMDRAAEINSDRIDLQNEAIQLQLTREQRVADRNRLTMDAELLELLEGVTTADGGALKTENTKKLLTDEDIKLLLDVATRDYKLSYQQVTPNIQVSFGDVRETADVDGIMHVISERVAEVIDGRLVVAYD